MICSTCNKVSEAHRGESGEAEVKALQVSPSLNDHEHKWRDDQVDEQTPQQEEGNAGTLDFSLQTLQGEIMSFMLYNDKAMQQHALITVYSRPECNNMH